LFLAPFLLFLTVLGLSPSLVMERSLAGMDAQTKIAVSASLVLLPVKVTDGRGTFVSRLKVEDFRAFEDGQLQKLTVFEEGDTLLPSGSSSTIAEAWAPSSPMSSRQ
jgi:hypothetical protein